MTEYIVVIVTIDDKGKAEEISNILVEEKLVACCNIINNVNSIYWWQGKVEKAEELVIVIKTKGDKFDKLLKRVKELHPYEVPEVIALPIIEGNKAYLEWIDESLS